MSNDIKISKVLNDPNRKIKIIQEEDITIVASVENYYIDFLVYKHDCTIKDSAGVLTPQYHKKDSPCYPTPVETIEESEPYLRGFVKWDGCSNWYFVQQDRCMLHGCSREDLLWHGKIMALCWDFTMETLPTWSN